MSKMSNKVNAGISAVKEAFVGKPSTSEKNKVDGVDVAKVVRTTLIVSGAAAAPEIASALSTIDLGSWEIPIMVGLAAVGEFLMRLSRDNTVRYDHEEYYDEIEGI